MRPKSDRYVYENVVATLQESMCDVAYVSLLEAESTKNIEVVHKDVLHLKQPFLKTGWRHFLKIAKQYGTKEYVMKGLLNLERWNKRRNPEIAKHAREIINKLETSKAWQELKTTKEPAKIKNELKKRINK